MAEVREAVRRLALGCGAVLSDYDSSGKCCGFGGHMELANPALYDEITASRCAESELPFLVYCVNCREVFQVHGKPCAHILDLVFGLEQRGVLTLEEKKENILRVKGMLLQEHWGETFVPQASPWDTLKVETAPAALKKMERLLIPLSDVKETIWRNEESGEGFQNDAGEVVCRTVGNYLTCWVRYTREGETYRVSDVYAHRMHIREDGAA